LLNRNAAMPSGAGFVAPRLRRGVSCARTSRHNAAQRRALVGMEGKMEGKRDADDGFENSTN
jgi:hypothetical protein